MADVITNTGAILPWHAVPGAVPELNLDQSTQRSYAALAANLLEPPAFMALPELQKIYFEGSGLDATPYAWQYTLALGLRIKRS